MMTGMFGSLLFSCFFLGIDSVTDQVLKPRNVSLLWVNGFRPKVSWEPPRHSTENCSYELQISTGKIKFINQTYWTDVVVMEGGHLRFDVCTHCNGAKSLPAVVEYADPELVRDLHCYLHSSRQTNCSWIPASNATDLRFFYYLVEEGSKEGPSPHIQECPSYTHGVRSGCTLQANLNHSVSILFNGTLNNRHVRNTFTEFLLHNVRPLALNWTVVKSGDEFIINWTPPDFAALSLWKFVINYTECEEEKIKDVSASTSAVLPLQPQCSYRMAVKAELRGEKDSASPWSEEKYFDAETEAKAWVYVAVLIPLMFSLLAALTFLGWSKIKEKVFPKIPVPRDLLSDISNNNFKSPVSKLYIPAEEEDSCRITLVMDPPQTKPSF